MIKPVAVPEHRLEPSLSVTGWDLLDHLQDYHLLKKDSAPWSYLLTQLFWLSK
jgi:hypothetical protein